MQVYTDENSIKSDKISKLLLLVFFKTNGNLAIESLFFTIYCDFAKL